MRCLRSAIACLAVVVTTHAAHAAPPARPKPLRGAETTAEGITIRGRGPAARVAWLAAVRERVHDHIEVRAEVGFGVADADGIVHLALPSAPGRRVLWALTDLGTSEAARLATNVEPSSDPLEIAAAAGASTLSVESSEVHLLYARAHGHAWTTAVHDGGSLDGDGTLNGQIVIALGSLRAIHGNVPPPASTQSGDVILAIHPRSLRGAEVIVP
jgi:hypothetical protein